MKKFLIALAMICTGACCQLMAQDPYADLDENDIFGLHKIKENYGIGIPQTWEYRLDADLFTTSGAHNDTGSDEGLALNFTMAYNLNKWVSLGASTGYFHDYGIIHGVSVDGGINPNDLIPLLGDVQVRWNFARKWAFFIEGRGGMLWSVKPSAKLSNGRKFEYSDYGYYEIQPGLLIRPNRIFEVRLSAGLGYANPFNEDKDFKGTTEKEHTLHFKIGIARRFGD